MDDLKIKNYASAQDFLNETKSLLLKNEAEYSLLLGLAMLRLQVTNEDTYHYYSVVQNNELIGCAVMTNVNLILTRIPGTFLPELAQTLFDQKIQPPGVVGPVHSTEAFAQCWKTISGRNYKLGMGQKVYELTQVTMPESSDLGELVLADLSHEELVKDWLIQFRYEATPHDTSSLESTIKLARSKIEKNEVYLLKTKDQKIVSMNMIGRPTDHGISVSGVYTPPELRKKGYASVLVAKTSEKMLQQGRKFCVLYTDLANPTSNKIYQEVGYREVARSKHFVFEGVL